MKSNEDSITIEEIPVGNIPDWLFVQFVNQAIDPRPISKGGPSKILTIYPNEDSRREQMSRLSDIGFAFDRTLHHTLDSLKSSLMADLRMPRKISPGPAFDVVLHHYCSEKASKLAFPLINPLPNMSWGEGKTMALSQLHSFLSSESEIETWEGPGIVSFTKILGELEGKIGGTHPDFLSSKILNGIGDGKIPFTLLDIDGIVMLDHSPSLNRSDTLLLKSLSQIKPIHQLTYPGSYRLGHHGLQLVDKFPISGQEQIPHWIPKHEISNKKEQPVVDRVYVNREDQSFEASITFARSLLEEDPSSSVLIVDPAYEENQWRWNDLILSLGLPVSGIRAPMTSSTLGHWLHELANIGNGPNAFSMEKIRLLAIQESLAPFPNLIPDEENTQIYPFPDTELLSNIARSEHILGGPGALQRWMEALSRPSKKIEQGPSRESTQWWLISLASSLSPLLGEMDRRLLSEERLLIGCHTGQILNVPKPPSSGDEWLGITIKQIDVGFEEKALDGNSLPSSTILQAIISEHEALRNLQRAVGQEPPRNGNSWVGEISSILRNTSLPVSVSGVRSRLRVLSPMAALGCNPDLLILANTSSSSWNLKSPKIPFIGEMERYRYGLLRPDAPITEARHHLSHIVNCCQRVVLIDPSLDKATPLAAPVEEILQYCSPPTHFDPSTEENLGPRERRQTDGILLRKMMPSVSPPLNPSSITIPLDRELQRDRERRQPRKANDEGYLPSKYRNRVISFDYEDLTRKTPRDAESPRSTVDWPVIGATNPSGKKSTTIDPRPFIPSRSGSDVSDRRHGHSTGSEQDIELWSPSRLQEWARCPRRGWLSRGLRIRDEETQSEDLDPRIHGDLLHQIHHNLICEILGMEEGHERNPVEALDRNEPRNLSSSGMSEEEIMKVALESLDRLAPWLDRTDGVSTYRLRMLTGMSRSEWSSWLANPKETTLGGRIGAMIRSEMGLLDTMPVALEWEISNGVPLGTEISLDPSDTSPHQSQLPPLMVTGLIDRVDLIPFDDEGKVWVDENGIEGVAPIRISGTDWKPRRRVLIRDLKTSESKPEDRHKKGLLDELQLAIYARAWEVTHPGDLVVAAGISVIGHSTKHILEASVTNLPDVATLSIGKTTSLTSELHRFPNESGDPQSDPFRAWLAQRLSVALGVAQGAIDGRVHPTPSKSACGYCPVSSICEVRMEDDF